MDILTAARLMRFCFGVVLIWATFYLSIRAYLVDQLRQELFAIRDDLFDFAADGGISFEDRTYRRLRQDLNSLIRFAHKVSMFRLLFANWMTTAEMRARQQAEWKQWLTEVDQLPAIAKKKLLTVRLDALSTLIQFVFQRSLVLLLLYWLVRTAALWLNAARALTRRLPTLAEPLEAQARDDFDFAA